MKKTIKTAALKEPGNYWISRRIYADKNGMEYVKINGDYISIDWLMIHDWTIDIVF